MAAPSAEALLRIDQLPDNGNIDPFGLNAPEAVRARVAPYADADLEGA
jgi:hypothetical protein